MNTFEINFHYGKNYGAFLQAYALSKKEGCTIVDFRPNYTFLVSKRGKGKIPFFWRLYALYKYLKIGIRLFYRLLDFSEYGKFVTTKPFSTVRQVQKFPFPNRSSFIAGSDQIWNPGFISQQEQIYFLNFGPDKAKRISYAASLGMKAWPKPFEQKVLPMLQRFDAISVREESAVSYLTSLGLKNVVCVCDPTILHKGDFYRKEFPYEKIEEEFSFVYRIREVVPDSVQSILLPQNREIWLSKPRRWRLPSVTQWLQNIDNAKFVVTDSFHCAVFCILFHKPFLVIPNRSSGKGMNERFATLLGKTGLEYRCLTCEESSEEVLQKLNTPIDWEKVDAILEDWRTYSANWLEKALGE